jgi:hypothetical protein
MSGMKKRSHFCRKTIEANVARNIYFQITFSGEDTTITHLTSIIISLVFQKLDTYFTDGEEKKSCGD